jgi:hypothetical protein
MSRYRQARQLRVISKSYIFLRDHRSVIAQHNENEAMMEYTTFGGVFLSRRS